MKKTLIITLLSFIGFGCGEKKSDQYKEGKYSYFYERIAVDEFYRKIIGYDSVEIIGKFMDADKLELNYCYPNQWEREKYKIIGVNDTLCFDVREIIVVAGVTPEAYLGVDSIKFKNKKK